MKLYLLAGETSGDIHAADVMKAFKVQSPSIQFRFMGGDRMCEVDPNCAFHIKDFAIMGFVEVVKNFRQIKQRFKAVEQDIRAFNPDAILFIDFPGFNLRLAKKIYQDFPLYYYISPKAWAWNKRRVVPLSKYFNAVYSILPFEIEFFEKHNVPIKYVGNPSLEQVKRYIEKQDKAPSRDYIALFPGSRVQEVERILPIMLEAVRSLAIDYKISRAPGMNIDVLKPFVQEEEQIIDDNYNLLYNAKAAIVTSGTATLETALFDVPQVVCYIANPISYRIAKLLVNIKYISLVNLILNEEIVKERIQEQCNSEQIRCDLKEILTPNKQELFSSHYKRLEVELGNCKPSKKIPEAMRFDLKNTIS